MDYAQSDAFFHLREALKSLQRAGLNKSPFAIALRKHLAEHDLANYEAEVARLKSELRGL